MALTVFQGAAFGLVVNTLALYTAAVYYFGCCKQSKMQPVYGSFADSRLSSLFFFATLTLQLLSLGALTWYAWDLSEPPVSHLFAVAYALFFVCEGLYVISLICMLVHLTEIILYTAACCAILMLSQIVLVAPPSTSVPLLAAQAAACYVALNSTFVDAYIWLSSWTAEVYQYILTDQNSMFTIWDNESAYSDEEEMQETENSAHLKKPLPSN